MKFGLIVLTFIAAIGGLVFHDQVAGLFAGMTPLEALEFVTMFVLKAAILACISWLAVHLPEMIRPWMNMRRRSLRQKRRDEARAVTPATRMPRGSHNAAMQWMMSQLQRQTRTGTPRPTKAGGEPPIIRFE